MRDHSSHLFVSRLINEADRGPRLAALPENRPRRNQVAPVCCSPIVAACCGFARSARTSCRSSSTSRRRRSRARRLAWRCFVDWREQAEDMVWLLAERDGETVGAGFALTGWHTPPHRAIGAALVPPEHRGTGVGIALLDAIEGWAARPRRDGARRGDQRGRRGKPRLGGRARLHRGRTQLAGRPRPDRDRRARPGAAAGRRDRHVGGAARAGRGAMGGRTRGDPRHPRRGGGRHRHARRVARPRHGRRRR